MYTFLWKELSTSSYTSTVSLQAPTYWLISGNRCSRKLYGSTSEPSRLQIPHRSTSRNGKSFYFWNHIISDLSTEFCNLNLRLKHHFWRYIADVKQDKKKMKAMYWGMAGSGWLRWLALAEARKWALLPLPLPTTAAAAERGARRARSPAPYCGPDPLLIALTPLFGPGTTRPARGRWCLCCFIFKGNVWWFSLFFQCWDAGNKKMGQLGLGTVMGGELGEEGARGKVVSGGSIPRTPPTHPDSANLQASATAVILNRIIVGYCIR